MSSGVHRIVTDVLWLVAGTYIALLILREGSVLAADAGLPSLARALEFPIGTGGRGAGTGA